MECPETPRKLNNICRICAKPQPYLIHLYGNRAYDQKLIEKIELHWHITIAPEENMTKLICLLCVGKLESIHKLWDSVQGKEMAEKKELSQPKDDVEEAVDELPNLAKDLSIDDTN